MQITFPHPLFMFLHRLSRIKVLRTNQGLILWWNRGISYSALCRQWGHCERINTTVLQYFTCCLHYHNVNVWLRHIASNLCMKIQASLYLACVFLHFLFILKQSIHPKIEQISLYTSFPILYYVEQIAVCVKTLSLPS